MTIRIFGLAVEVDESTLDEKLALIRERASIEMAIPYRTRFISRLREIDARLAGTEEK